MKFLKNNKKIIVLVCCVLLLLVLFCVVKTSKRASYINKAVDKTISTKSGGYKLDLRLEGIYNLTKIYNIIMVDNYKNTDKNIRITDALKSNTNVLVKNTPINYIVKDSKYYQVVDEKLTTVDKISYEDTDVYLTSLKDVKKLKKVKEEKTYQIYSATLKNKQVNKMLEKTTLFFSTDKDADVEIWVDAEGRIYKALYKIGNLNISAVYSAYGVTSPINLDIYNNKKA